ncbi:MAG: hypothetical protein GY722_17845 [bacterium]|nr:hypothetical protein [bacterium]
MRSLSLAPLLLALSTTLAHGQTVLFEDDFSDPQLSNWVAQWAIGYTFYTFDLSHPCAGAVTPLPSGNRAVRAGIPGACAFAGDCGCGETTLSLVTPVHIPAGAEDVRLTFWSYDDVECASCGWDWRFVYVSDDGGASWTFIGESDQLLNWYQKSFDLTPWAGSDVLIRFLLDPVDAFGNTGLGWLIDDVEIVMDACAPPANYCISSPNSTGAGAVMSWSGSTSIAADDLTLSFAGAPPSQFAIFFYGPDSGQTPVSDGYLCIGRGAVGFVRMGGIVQIDASGHASLAVDYAGSFNGPGWLTPGSTWNFQGWYRDPAAANTGSNFTDGLAVRFCP